MREKVRFNKQNKEGKKTMEGRKILSPYELIVLTRVTKEGGERAPITSQSGSLWGVGGNR
jgi:hypothetical protein